MGENSASSTQGNEGQAPVMAKQLGEMLWLMGRCPVHRNARVGDMDWMLLPPMMLGQYKIYYADDQPIAFVIWAMMDAAGKQAMKETGKIAPAQWRAGDDDWRHLCDTLEQENAEFDATQVAGKITTFDQYQHAKEADVVIMSMVAPSATPENKLKEVTIADLNSDALKGQGFRLKFVYADEK